MKTIYFSGKAGDGKTATVLGIALKLMDKGLKVSYFKPIGFQQGPTKRDDDVVLMRDVLKLPFSSDTISPVSLTPQYLTGPFQKDAQELLEKLDESFTRCSEGYDILLIDGCMAPFVGTSLGIDNFSLAGRWNTPLVYVMKPDNDFQFDEALLCLDHWNCSDTNVIGCIFNNISRPQWEKTRSLYKPVLENKGYAVLGVIPCHPEIAAPTVAEFNDALQGEVLVSPENMNRIVEEVVIGTMTIESALSYLRRAPNKALVTGGDRSDMALTALETSTSVIIFTGGLYPDVAVLTRAEEKGVPVILVHEDTFATVEHLHSVYRSIHPQNKNAQRIIAESVDKHLEWKRLLDYINK